MVHYTYHAAVMPPTPHVTLLEFIKKALLLVENAIKANGPVELPWLYIDKETASLVMNDLAWWAGPRQTEVDFPLMFKTRLAMPFLHLSLNPLTPCIYQGGEQEYVARTYVKV